MAGERGTTALFVSFAIMPDMSRNIAAAVLRQPLLFSDRRLMVCPPGRLSPPTSPTDISSVRHLLTHALLVIVARCLRVGAPFRRCVDDNPLPKRKTSNRSSRGKNCVTIEQPKASFFSPERY